MEVRVPPDKPDSERGIKWERVEPVVRRGKWAMWKFPVSSSKTVHKKHLLESAERLLASLMAACLLGALASIIYPPTRQITISLLSQAAKLSLADMGTTAFAVGVGLVRFIQAHWNDWRSDMRKLWADIGKGATVTVIVWFGLFAFCFFEAVNLDRQPMTSMISSLRQENKQLHEDNKTLMDDKDGLAKENEKLKTHPLVRTVTLKAPEPKLQIKTLNDVVPVNITNPKGQAYKALVVTAVTNMPISPVYIHIECTKEVTIINPPHLESGAETGVLVPDAGSTARSFDVQIESPAWTPLVPLQFMALMSSPTGCTVTQK